MPQPRAHTCACGALWECADATDATGSECRDATDSSKPLWEYCSLATAEATGLTGRGCGCSAGRGGRRRVGHGHTHSRGREVGHGAPSVGPTVTGTREHRHDPTGPAKHVLEERGGGVWNPNDCVAKMAQIHISFCKFRFFPL